MSLWSTLESRCVDEADDFERPPNGFIISLRHRRQFDALQVSPHWMEERTMLEDKMEMPVNRPFTLRDGPLYYKLLNRMTGIREHLTVGPKAKVHDIALFPPSQGPDFVDWNGCRRAYIETLEPISGQDVVTEGREFLARRAQEFLDENAERQDGCSIHPSDVLRFSAIFSDFEACSADRLNAKVLTTCPEAYHPDMDSVEDIATTVGDTPAERDRIRNASTYGEAHIEDVDSIPQQGMDIAERGLDNTIARNLDVDAPFVVEGEVLRANVAPLPNDAYDVLSGVADCDGASVGELLCGFWLFLPPADDTSP